MERRRFFRIDDTLELYCEALSDEQVRDTAATMQPTEAQDVLAGFDRQIQTVIEAARVQAPAVANLAEMLNRKLNYVISTLGISEELVERMAFRARHVNLSACGIGFDSDTAYETGQRVRLEMRLQPNNLHLVVLAKVVACERLVDGRDGLDYNLRLNFTDMSSADQELLIQHIVRRQGQQLQELREQREADPGRSGRD